MRASPLAAVASLINRAASASPSAYRESQIKYTHNNVTMTRRVRTRMTTASRSCSVRATIYLAFSASCCAICLRSMALVNSGLKLRSVMATSFNF